MGVEVIPGELDPFSIAIAILSGFIVIFGFVSMFVKERLFISEACKRSRSSTLLLSNASLPGYFSRGTRCRYNSWAHCS